MNLHICKDICWHLIAKNNLRNVVFQLYEVTEIGKAWEFVKQMKREDGIVEIIWSRYQNGKLQDEPAHLKYQDGVWVRNDIAEWKDKA